MSSASNQRWIHILIITTIMAASYAQDGEFIDYYENLDGDNLPEDYKELYDYYNYYNGKDDYGVDANANGRSVPTEDVVEAAYEGANFNGGGGWDSYGSERERERERDSYGSERDRLYGGSEERIEAEAENLRRFASAAIPKSEDNDKDNEENNKSDAEWRRDLVYKTYREQLEAYNKLVREEHAARYVTTRGTTTTTTTTTTPPVTRSKAVDPKDLKGCRDSDSRCERWGLNGWCALWKPITQVYCRKTCGFCDGMDAPCTDDADVAPYCKNWKKNGDCKSDRDYMFQRCPATCGFCGDDDGLRIVKRR